MTRSSLVWETRFVMLVFLWPAVTSAVVLFAESVAGRTGESQFPNLVHGNTSFNLIFGIVAYLPVAAVVPIALYQLTRTGQPPKALGLGRPRFMDDILPGAGLALAAYGCELVLLIALLPLIRHHSSLINSVHVGHVPDSYIVFGLTIALFTSVAEEVLVNGYLITRLNQLGWTPWAALSLSLVLRTSYHVYYGLGFVLTIPFGYLVTRSFQKHGRLNRSIAAHFLYDASIFTISILAH